MHKFEVANEHTKQDNLREQTETNEKEIKN